MEGKAFNNSISWYHTVYVIRSYQVHCLYDVSYICFIVHCVLYTSIVNANNFKVTK